MQSAQFRERKKPAKSVLRLVGYDRGHCGYCNLDNERISYGALSHSLLVDDYLQMMHGGWRRSGKYLYKPTNFATCCPCYTIRLRVADFQISKSQRKVLKNMDKFLNKRDKITENNYDSKGSWTDHSKVLVSKRGEKEMEPNEEKKIAGELQTKIEGNGGVNRVQDETHVEGDEVSKKRLTIETVDAECTEERFELYKKYQIAVHKDKPEDVTKIGFTRFLVESPLVPEERAGVQGTALSFGCKHQLYRIDGRLVAVGVIDLLPDGLSSVYTYYDPDHRELVLGKFSALQEIEYTKELGLQYYYMGFYIHDCEKMRYKAEYKPSELLCGTSLEWFPYAACKPLLDQDNDGSGYCVYTPFHPSYLQLRAELGLSAQERKMIKMKTEILAKNASKVFGELGSSLAASGQAGTDQKPGNERTTATDASGNRHLQLDEEKKESVTDVERQEEAIHEDIARLLSGHELEPLAPQFSNSSMQMVEEVTFSIGEYDSLLLRHLHPSANIRRVLKGYLWDFVLNCGGDYAKKVLINFN